MILVQQRHDKHVDKVTKKIQVNYDESIMCLKTKTLPVKELVIATY